MPKRIQRRRTKDWRMPADVIYVGRPSKYGNPFKLGDRYKESHRYYTHYINKLSQILRAFEAYARDRVIADPTWLEPLRGRDLACWCPESEACHADILLRLANADPDTIAGLKPKPVRSEHSVWHNMISRCENPNVEHYQDYGGRGIKVCKRWRHSFATFLEDMGERPSLKHSIDRIDNDGDYTPENCRWATPKQQNRNKRDSRMLTFRGVTKCLSEWAEDLGFTQATIYHRLNTLGWDIEKALTTPQANRKRNATLSNSTTEV